MGFKDLDALTKAIAMEEEGRQFYLEAALKAKNDLAKRIFEELASAEETHIEAFKRISKEVKDGKPIREWITTIDQKKGVEKVFEEALLEKAAASDDDISALRFGLEIEQKSIDYYEDLASKAEDNFEKRFYLALSYEERGHYLKIIDSIEYLTDPEGWIFLRDGRNLDG